ncbi:CACNA2D4 family protein [Megaselia abdita]
MAIGVRNLNIFIGIFIIFFFFKSNVFVVSDPEEDIPHNEVRNWALKFGVDLWEFGRQFTKMQDIKSKFEDDSFEVKRKDGILLLRELASEVKNFLDFKKNAVMRIMDSAEQAALSESNTQSHSSSGTQHYDARKVNEYNSDGKLSDGARHLDLIFMRRFERLPVNLTFSTILVPELIDLEDNDVKNALQWSSHLDPLFQSNLERDPGLSWQYFGSTTGFLRRFPGTAWPPEGSKGSREIYDFRLQQWFIQASSSPKDFIILLDTSSSISWKNYEIAKETIATILDTMGENDFFNIFIFTDSVKSLISCFQDKLMRATPTNKEEVKMTLNSVTLGGSFNYTAGLEYSFNLLHKYNITYEGSQCNQAIMIATSSMSESQEDIIKQYNWPHRPVRIFPYLIGKGDSSSEDILHNMACSNKGFFAHINSVEDVKVKIAQYALVMARPMIMYQADHPVYWSSVFLAGKSSGLGPSNENKRRLVTTVSAPVFDRRNYSVREAKLLGVVGTDVPIEEIIKIIPQHKLGPSGYAFIIDNNGRIVYHPKLKPLYDGDKFIDKLYTRYSSVDITDLEIPESEIGSDQRLVEINRNLLNDMRNDMIKPKEGETDFTVLKHYDNMRRVNARKQRYFYGPIDETPFTLAVVLPDKYGNHEFVAQHEIRHSRMNVTEYFKGNDWRIHPDWVYCEYNSLGELERDREGESNDPELSFSTPEEQLLHFLARAGRQGWKWMSMRPKSPQPHHFHGAVPVGHFGQQYNLQGNRKTEPYFCDRTLVQSLVKDAIVTNSLDNNETSFISQGKNQEKRQGYQKFNVATSFIATRSGLLRWIDHMKILNNEPYRSNFGEENARAIESLWYERAIDQYFVEQDSFVYSVPFDSSESKTNGTLVTASHAIYIDHRGHKAPAAVVGLKFEHDTISKHFINITSACTGTTSCKRTCASDNLDCYVLDNNGFIIISEQPSHTGNFFGQIDGTIMDSLVQDKIYKRISVVDYQGFCSDANNPFTATAPRVKWVLPGIFKYVVRLFFAILTYSYNPINAWPQEDYIYNDEMFEPEYTDEYEPFDYMPEVIPESTPTAETLSLRNQKSLMIRKARLI